MRRLKILTWHVHGSYLFNLAQTDHDFILPVLPGRPERYGGRSGHFPWPENVQEVTASAVHDLEVDLVLYQSAKNYETDQYEILSPRQLELPRIYLEHNAPRPSPIDSPHPVDDPRILLVHCTHYNALMWDNRRTPTMVVPHGVFLPNDPIWSGEIERGIVVVNGLERRGRLAGRDIFLDLRQQVPLDLAGMDSERYGGLGDLPHAQLHETEARYRFFFSPIRYTSLPLAVIEAMTIGMPVVVLATTELTRAIADGDTGLVSNDLDELVEGMRRLLVDRNLARRLGQRAREVALTEYGISRFRYNWDAAFQRALAEE